MFNEKNIFAKYFAIQTEYIFIQSIFHFLFPSDFILHARIIYFYSLKNKIIR